MKTRESGMPAEELWRTFFDPETILMKLGLTADCSCVIDLGCGFGTFAVPAARRVRGVVHAVDIDDEMIAVTREKAPPNLNVWQRDFVEQGCGLPDATADYVMLFNILHAEESPSLLAEAKRVLRPGGHLAVMHWNYDPTTPRGPSMSIRLKPAACRAMMERAGFAVSPLITLPPHHYGFVGHTEIGE